MTKLLLDFISLSLPFNTYDLMIFNTQELRFEPLLGELSHGRSMTLDDPEGPLCTVAFTHFGTYDYRSILSAAKLVCGTRYSQW